MESNVRESHDTYDFYFLHWSCEDVGQWIEELGFPQYKMCFTENFITGRKLIHVNYNNMPKLGITDFEHIKVICGHVRALLQITESPWDTRVMFLHQKSRTGVQADRLSYQELLNSVYGQDRGQH